jgi:hypothetical protein
MQGTHDYPHARWGTIYATIDEYPLLYNPSVLQNKDNVKAMQEDRLAHVPSIST